MTEITDTFLERDIPALVVENGLFQRVESNKFNLMSRAECVKEEIVELNAKAYEKKKKFDLIKKETNVREDPFESLLARCGDNPALLDVVRGIDVVGIDDRGSILRNKFERMM
ncbi:hypothetical protein D3C81_1891970 [compost metagenome]